MSKNNYKLKPNQQVLMIKAMILMMLFIITVQCTDNKQPKKREVHRIVIVPDRNRNKKRPTKGSAFTHYFNNPELQVHPTQFSNGLNQISYNNKRKLPAKNRYHEMQLPEHFFKDSFLDGSSNIHISNSKNGWKPISGKHNQNYMQSPKYNFIPGIGISTSSNRHTSSSSTTTSKRPSSNQNKTNKKNNRSNSRFSTTGQPRHKSVVDMIELTTTFPQPLPPIQTYLNIMTDLHQTADQSQNYLYQNVLVRPRLRKIKSSTSTTYTPKTTKTTTKATSSKPYEVYENIDEDFPSSVAASGSGVNIKHYGKRLRSRQPATHKTLTQ